MSTPMSHIAGNGSHGELVLSLPSPASAHDHHLATQLLGHYELLGHYVQPVHVSVFVDRAQYCRSIQQLSRRSTKSRTYKLTDKKRLAIERKIIQPRVAAGKIVADKLREVFNASSSPTKEACPPLNNSSLPRAAPPSLPPMTSHSIIPS